MAVMATKVNSTVGSNLEKCFTNTSSICDGCVQGSIRLCVMGGSAAWKEFPRQPTGEF